MTRDVVPRDERVVSEAHALAGEVHAEGPIKACVDCGLHGVEPHRVGIDPRGVDPSASHLVALLEDHHAETRKSDRSSRAITRPAAPALITATWQGATDMGNCRSVVEGIPAIAIFHLINR
jgi:hypothetical protein